MLLPFVQSFMTIEFLITHKDSDCFENLNSIDFIKPTSGVPEKWEISLKSLIMMKKKKNCLRVVFDNSKEAS